MGQAISEVTGTRLWAVVFSLPGNDFDFVSLFVLCGCRHGRSAAVVQRFVHVSTYPERMQQYRQLSSRRHDGSLLAASSATLGRLQPPAPEIAVHTERSQNVLRALYQQRAQVRIAFLADVHLRLVLPRVSSSWLQSQIAAYVVTFAEAMRIFQRQHVGESDQRAHALDLLQQRHLRKTLLRQLLDALVVWSPFTLCTEGEIRIDGRLVACCSS